MRINNLSESDKATLVIARDALAQGRITEALYLATSIPGIEIESDATEVIRYLDPTPQVGDVLYNSWGYDQTNINFYQVVSKTAKRIRVREIASRASKDQPGAPYQVTVEPDLDNYLLPPCVHCHRAMTVKTVNAVCTRRPIVGPIDRSNSCHVPYNASERREWDHLVESGAIKTPTINASEGTYSVNMRHGYCGLYLGGGCQETGTNYGH